MPAPPTRPAASALAGMTRHATAALGLAALALLAACGGGGGGATTEPVAPPAGTLALARSGELVAQAQKTLRARATTGSTASLLGFAGPRLLDSAAISTGSAAAAAARPTTAMALGGRLLLEAGIEEADLLKAGADGALLWSIDGTGASQPVVQAHRRAVDGSLGPPTRVPMHADDTTWMRAEGLVLSPEGQAATAVAVGWVGLPFDQLCQAEVCLAAAGSGGMAAAMIAPGWIAPRVLVQRFELGASGGPSARLSIEGELVDQRQVGQQLVLVTRHRPVLAVDLLPASASAAQREAAIAGLGAAALLPRLRVNGGAEQPLVQETDCWLQPDNASPLVEFTTVTLIDLARPDLPRTSRCLAGAAEALHFNGRDLVLAQTNVAYSLGDQGLVHAGHARTQIHLLTLEGGTLAFQASGEVIGHLGWDRGQAAYRLSVHDGDVRVLSYTGTTAWTVGSAPSPARLTILRRSAATPTRLEVLASLPNAAQPQPIGKPDEQLYGVRFAGDRAYAVTFRLTDPLYVLDLSDPRNPRVAGALELPGFSDHLVPLADGLLLGVGHDANAGGQRAGLQLALFDVRDAARPALLDRLRLGAAGSASALDHGRQGLSLGVRDQVARLALPVALTDSDWGPRSSSLQTATIDLRGRRLVLGPALDTRQDEAPADLWQQRSLQLGDRLYWLRGGEVLGLDWPGS